MMRSTFSILFFVLFASVFAQRDHNFGFRAGANIANVSPEYNGILDPKIYPGIQVGFSYEYNFFSSYFLRSGLFFSEKGFKSNRTVWIEGANGLWPYSVEEKSKFRYLDLPLALAYKFPISTSTRFIVEGGFYGSALLGGKITYAAYGQESSVGNDGKLKSYDFGYLFGAAFEFEVFQIGVQLNNGLININDNDFDYDVNIKNQNISIYVAYLFGRR